MKMRSIIVFVGVTIIAWLSCKDSTAPNVNQFSPVGRLEISDRPNAEITGFVSPSDGKEYAVIGHWPTKDGVSIIDVSDPAAPRRVSLVENVPGFDVKYWNNYLYTVNGSSSGQGSIINVTDPSQPVLAGNFPSSHNIFIAENGFMYAEVRGLKIYNLNSTPTAPALVWSGGVEGHDATVVGDRLYDFHGGLGGGQYCKIYDVSNPAQPALLGQINDPSIRYYHSGWPTEDGNHLFICDELAPDSLPDFTVWDISDLSNPQKVAEFRDPDSRIHNLYIIGDFAYVSFYAAGFRVFDVSDPTRPALIKQYDTSAASTPTFQGAWGCYPFNPSGNILVSDDVNGLFIFKP